MNTRVGIKVGVGINMMVVLLSAGGRAGQEPLQMLPVTIIGSPQNMETIAGSGDFIGAGDIQAQNHDDINRVLRRVPGVYLREEDGFGLFPNISLRGVDGGRSSKVTIMEDGVLASPAPYSAPAAYYSPSAGRMHAIEVLKGSSQIKYGPQTSGGVINYLSTPASGKAGGVLRVLYGTDNELRNHLYYGDSVDASMGRIGYLVEYYDRRTDGFKSIDETPDFTAGDKTGFSRREPMLKLFWEPVSDRYQQFEFKIGHTELVANETYMGLSDTDFHADPYRRYAGSRFDRIETRQTRTHLRHHIEVTADLLLTTTAYYSEFQRNWFKERTTGKDIADPTRLAVLKGEAPGSLRYRNNNREYTALGLESQMGYTVALDRHTHRIEAGVRLHRDDVRRLQRDDTFIQSANGTITDRLPGAPGSGGNREEEATALALYVQDAVAIGRWTLIPGVRVERIRMAYTDFDTTGAPNAVTGRGDDTLHVAAPGLGVIVGVDAFTSIFGGVYRGFSIPDPRAYAKDGIREETSLGYELGIRHTGRHGLMAEAVFFYTDFDNLIVPDLVGAGGGAEGTENVGGVITFGAELKAAIDAGVLWGLGVGNPWYAAATLTRAEIDTDTRSLNEESIFAGGHKGARVPYIPELQFLIGTGLERGRWRAYLDISYVDATYTSASNVTGQEDSAGRPNAAFGRTDAHVLVDLSTRYQLGENLALTASVHNLLDEDYIAARHPAGPRPGKPRTVLAGLDVRF